LAGELNGEGEKDKMKTHKLDFRPKRIISVGYESFEWFINGVIILSIAIAAIEFASAESYQPFIYIQCSILGIFIAEMIVKYIALGRELFKGWNLFDFLSVVLIIICEILFIYGGLATILRITRIILRSLRFLLKAKQNKEYLAKLEESYKQMKEGKIETFTIEELENFAK
jgi:hypothetical protein